MNKDEYGELLKYLGILRYALIKEQMTEREFELYKKELDAITLLINQVPIISNIT